VSLAAWRPALRRGAVPLVAGALCLLLAWPLEGDLARLLTGLGVVLVLLGLVIVVAAARAAGTASSHPR
jgi:hypothetical protein